MAIEKLSHNLVDFHAKFNNALQFSNDFMPMWLQLIALRASVIHARMM